jgi:hypothetical protein
MTYWFETPSQVKWNDSVEEAGPGPASIRTKSAMKSPAVTMRAREVSPLCTLDTVWLPEGSPSELHMVNFDTFETRPVGAPKDQSWIDHISQV